jgi:hypothetical protein
MPYRRIIEMTLCRYLSVFFVAAVASGCASTIAPQYTTDKPDIMRIGEHPQDSAAVRDKAGSFCLETVDKWHNDGTTPDGQALWAKDTLRKVIPCGQ